MAAGGAGCARPSDAEAYLAGDCAGIAAPALRGECVTFVAAALADGGDRDAAFSACAGLHPHPSADECHFYVVDRLALGREEAITACAGAGRHRDRCRGHAVRRDAARAMAQAGPAQEPAVEREIAAWPGVGPGRARALVVDLLAERLSGGAALGPAVCGAAAIDRCTAALIEAGRRSAGAREAVCAGTGGAVVDGFGAAVAQAQRALDCAAAAAASGAPGER